MSVYTRINEIREKRGITWKYLNENMPGKVYSSRMTELKNGKTTLNGEQLDAIAKILGTTSAYLLGVTDDPTPAGQKESSPQGGEPIGPNKRALLDLVDDMSEDEMAALLELIKVTKKMRGKEK